MIITGLIKLIELLSGKGESPGHRRAGGVNAHTGNKNENTPVHPSDTKHYRKSGGDASGIKGA